MLLLPLTRSLIHPLTDVCVWVSQCVPDRVLLCSPAGEQEPELLQQQDQLQSEAAECFKLR